MGRRPNDAPRRRVIKKEIETMTGAMYAAVAGLRSHMSALNVIGNNISNVNTLGYKAARYTFNEALYTTTRTGSNGTQMRGGRNPAQIGYGCSVGTIDLDMSSKNYVPTGVGLDCTIDGDGFFIVGDKYPLGITEQSQLQGMNLTRLGNIEFKDGYLVDGNGQVVYGFLNTGTGDNPNMEPILTPIRLPLCTKETIQVTQINQDTGETETVNKTRTIVYYPKRTNEGEIVDANAYVEDNEGGGGDEEDKLEYERLQLDSISIDEKSGRITGITSDDQTVIIGCIALAKVDSPNGVTHVDGRYYKALGGAGNVHLTTIGGLVSYEPPEQDDPAAGGGGEEGNMVYSNIVVESAGDTELVSGGLESSGTDLANEISNMIIIQRGYQANTRIVTVTDSMLEELVNMKR